MMISQGLIQADIRRKLLTRVKDIMKKGDKIPIVLNDFFISNALKE